MKNFKQLAGLLLALVLAPSARSAEWGDLTGKFIFDGPAPEMKKVDVTRDGEVLKGKDLFDETLVVGKDGGIANVIVYVRTPNVAINPDVEKDTPPKVMYDNLGLKFVPHILPIWLNKQTLVLSNSDPVSHNSNLQPILDTPINPLLPPKATLDHKFNRKQLIPQPVGCNIHPWMRGYILPRDNPYTAVTAADGTFKLEKLPVGELEFQIWQEKAGNLGPQEDAGKLVVKKGTQVTEVKGTAKIEKDGKTTATDWVSGRVKVKIAPGTNDLGTVKVSPKLFDK